MIGKSTHESEELVDRIKAMTQDEINDRIREGAGKINSFRERFREAMSNSDIEALGLAVDDMVRVSVELKVLIEYLGDKKRLIQIVEEYDLKIDSMVNMIEEV